MRIRTFALLLGVPLLLMGALIVGLQIGKDELEQTACAATATAARGRPGGTGGGHVGAARGVRLQRIGTFGHPLYVTAPPGDRRRRVRRRAGRADQRAASAASGCGGRSSTSAGDVTAGGEQGLLSMAFAPDYARSGRFYVYFTDRNGNTARAGVPALRAATRTAPTRPRGGQILFHGRPVPEPQRRACSCSAPTATSTSAWATAARAATRRTARRTSTRCSARSCGSTRARPGRARYRSPRLQPLRAAAPGATRSTPTGCATRGASRSTAATATSTSATSGQDAREEIDYARARQRARAQLRLELLRGHAALSTTHAAARARARPVLDYGRSHGECSVTAAWWCATRRCPALAGRYVYGDFCARPAAQLPDLRRPRDR